MPSKPFNPRELLARIRAIMRRSEKSPPQDPFAGKRIRFAHLELDYDGRTLTAPDGTQLTNLTDPLNSLTPSIPHIGTFTLLNQHKTN